MAALVSRSVPLFQRTLQELVAVKRGGLDLAPGAFFDYFTDTMVTPTVQSLFLESMIVNADQTMLVLFDFAIPPMMGVTLDTYGTPIDARVQEFF